MSPQSLAFLMAPAHPRNLQIPNISIFQEFPLAGQWSVIAFQEGRKIKIKKKKKVGGVGGWFPVMLIRRKNQNFLAVSPKPSSCFDLEHKIKWRFLSEASCYSRGISSQPQ